LNIKEKLLIIAILVGFEKASEASDGRKAIQIAVITATTATEATQER
jgi:hypothetical protein